MVLEEEEQGELCARQNCGDPHWSTAYQISHLTHASANQIQFIKSHTVPYLSPLKPLLTQIGVAIDKPTDALLPALSSTEAEFTAAAEAGKMVLYIRSILWELRIIMILQSSMKTIPRGALFMVTADQPTKRTCHMNTTKLFVVQDWIKEEHISLEAIINTQHNLNDHLTKALVGRIKFYQQQTDVIMGRHDALESIERAIADVKASNAYTAGNEDNKGKLISFVDAHLNLTVDFAARFQGFLFHHVGNIASRTTSSKRSADQNITKSVDMGFSLCAAEGASNACRSSDKTGQDLSVCVRLTTNCAAAGYFLYYRYFTENFTTTRYLQNNSVACHSRFGFQLCRR
eukprot:jgi/Psemu1/57706/gm1.57706_g